jgi:hypothetical protein
MNASDSHDRAAVPDFVPDEWVTRYGSGAAADHRTGTAASGGRDDARVVRLGLALCIGTYVITIVAAVLPAAGMWGFVGAAGVIAVVATGSTWLARRALDGPVRRLSRQADAADRRVR